MTPLVWPEMRLMAPGVEGPKVVPKEWSFMRVVLRVVPQGGDGVAVVVAHGEAVGGGDGGSAGRR